MEYDQDSAIARIAKLAKIELKSSRTVQLRCLTIQCGA